MSIANIFDSAGNAISQSNPLPMLHDLLTPADVVGTRKSGGFLYFASAAQRAADTSTTGGTGNMDMSGFDEIHFGIVVTNFGSGGTGIVPLLREQFVDSNNNNLGYYFLAALPPITGTGYWEAIFAKGNVNETAWSSPLATYNRILLAMAPPIRGGFGWSYTGTFSTNPTFGINLSGR